MKAETFAASTGKDAASLLRLVSALGVAQIISWGSLYYSLAVLATPIRAELDLSAMEAFGAFTLSLLLSGALAPTAGRWVDEHGGRRVMTAGSVVATLALLTIATAHGAVQYFIGWLLAGVAMAGCLYDPAFASLHRIAPRAYRRAVTTLTLFGGFASTVFWPLSGTLVELWSWRETLLLFAALHLAICAPIHFAVLPAGSAGADRSIDTAAATPAPLSKDRRFFWLAASFAASAFVFGALAAFMIVALTSRGLEPEQAVWIAALIGPMQVLGRATEWLVAERLSAIRIGVIATSLLLLAVLLLNVMPAMLIAGVAFAVAYGAANGIMTIVRGTVPAQLFGPSRQGALLGRLARPTFVAKALAPGMVAGALSSGLSMTAALALLALFAAVALACFAVGTAGAAWSPRGTVTSTTCIVDQRHA